MKNGALCLCDGRLLAHVRDSLLIDDTATTNINTILFAR